MCESLARVWESLAGVGYSYPVVRYLNRQRASAASDIAGGAPSPAAAAPGQATSAVLGRMLFAAAISGVALLGTWGAMQWAPSWAAKIGDPAEHPKEFTQISAALGAIAGTMIAAILGDWLGRRVTYCLLCIVSMGSLLLLYQGNTTYGPQFLAATVLAGFCTASFYGFLPLYLPELFGTGIRATGQGFGFNFGRILAAIGTLQTGALFAAEIRIGDRVFEGGYPFACSIMSSIYLVGLALIWLGPETRGRPLPD